MILLPAIDLYDGKVVRLTKGDYAQMTVYRDDPAAQAADFQAAGAKWLHTVDLEGAKDGTTPNFPVIAAICKKTDLKVEIGGGIRSLDTIQKYLDAGVSRVILGTAAVTDPKFLERALDRFGSQAAVGVDLKDGAIAIKGWKETAPERAEDFFTRLCGLGVKTVICTDISKDGMLGGANVELYQTLSQQFPLVSPGLHRLGRCVKCSRLTKAESPGPVRGHPGKSPVHRGPGFEDGFEGGGVRW